MKFRWEDFEVGTLHKSTRNIQTKSSKANGWKPGVPIVSRTAEVLLKLPPKSSLRLDLISLSWGTLLWDLLREVFKCDDTEVTMKPLISASRVPRKSPLQVESDQNVAPHNMIKESGPQPCRWFSRASPRPSAPEACPGSWSSLPRETRSLKRASCNVF